VQRRALGLLFSVLCLALVGIAVAALVGAHGAARWVIPAAAAALAAWLASLALSATKR
jgi:hypothetical protein